MSDTPISDSTPHNVADLGMQVRRLERQLNAGIDRIKRLLAERDTAQMKDTVAFIYVHKTNGVIRVESLERAKHIDGKPDWNHVSTVNVHVVLEQILRASNTEERELLIKHLLS